MEDIHDTDILHRVMFLFRHFKRLKLQNCLKVSIFQSMTSVFVVTTLAYQICELKTWVAFLLDRRLYRMKNYRTVSIFQSMTSVFVVTTLAYQICELKTWVAFLFDVSIVWRESD